MSKLRDIQLCELEILNEIDRICRKYSIRYCMVYGTFLGAVRHKGFIPWDDDVDISMPLEDFFRFEQVCKSELDPAFFLQTPKNDISPFSFYKMRANGTLMIEEGLRSLKMHHGIWVDIFPYVYASKSTIGRKIQIHCHNNINRIRARFYYSDAKSIFRRFFAKVPSSICDLLDDLNVWVLSTLGDRNSGQYFEMSRCKSIEDNYVDCDLLDNIGDYSFEGHIFRGPVDYNAYLSKCYGKNYMTPIKYAHIKDLDGVVLAHEQERTD